VARSKDNNVSVEPNGKQRFRDYCQKHCIDRHVNLQNLMIQEKGVTELCALITNSSSVARLNLRENILKDEVIMMLA
jgi:hypothetical protein